MSEHRHDHAHDDDHGHHHAPDHHRHAHDGDHDHIHGSALSRATHAISEVFGWHSHDTADQVDTALEADARGRRALWISLGALLATSAVQAAIFFVTGSVALLGDTLHNVADALTAVPLLIAFWLVRKPANDRYTYGYGRAEDLAGLFVVLTVMTSAVLAAYTAVERLVHPATVSHLGVLAAGGLVGFLGNEFVARYRITVGRRIGSAALIADGLHARTDGFASLAVVISAGGLALGWRWADAVVGIVIAIAIVGVLKSVIEQVGARLLDAVDPTLVAAARVALLSVEEIQSVDAIRMRWVGHNLFAEADVTVPADLSLITSHNLAHHAEDHLMEALPRLHATTVHVIPAASHD